MASRGIKKQQQRARTLTSSANQTKPFELTFQTDALPEPDRSFYAHTVASSRRGRVVSFYFAQLTPAKQDSIQTAVGIDIPYISLALLIPTFGAVRERFAAREREGFPDYPSTEPQNSVSHPAHFARMTVNDYLCVLDFFVLTHGPQRQPEVRPTVRIMGLPPILEFVVAECDRFAAEIER